MSDERPGDYGYNPKYHARPTGTLVRVEDVEGVFRSLFDGTLNNAERGTLRAALLAIRSLPTAGDGMRLRVLGWRTIDTAPKDGTKILLAKIVGHKDHETALWWAVRGFWSGKWTNWNDGVEPSGLADPTHWLPISSYGVGDHYTNAMARAALDKESEE